MGKWNDYTTKTALKDKEDEEGNPSVTANPEWEQF